MRADTTIAVRDAVDIFYDKGPQYKSLVNDVYEDGTLLVPIPSHLGALMPVRPGEELSMAFYRETGRYVVKIRIKNVRKTGNVEFVILEVISKPVKEQRRNFYRLPVKLRAYILPPPSEEAEKSGKKIEDEPLEKVKTNNISVSGISLKTKKEYKAGAQYMVKVYLGWPNETAPPVTVLAEVKRVNYESADETYNVGLHFIKQHGGISDHISKYILAQQQKLIRQKRLVEGE